MSKNLLANSRKGGAAINAHELFKPKRGRDPSEATVFINNNFNLFPPAQTFKSRHHSMQNTKSSFRQRTNPVRDNTLSKHGANYPSKRFLLPDWRQDPS